MQSKFRFRKDKNVTINLRLNAHENKIWMQVKCMINCFINKKFRLYSHTNIKF